MGISIEIAAKCIKVINKGVFLAMKLEFLRSKN